MTEERGTSFPMGKPRPANWTKLFGTFLVALDPFKLLVAAAGIMVTAFGWWLLSVIFYNAWTEPSLKDFEDKARKNSSLTSEEERTDWAKENYKKSLDTWALMHEMAGNSGVRSEKYAKWYQEKFTGGPARSSRGAQGYGGKYRTMPWAEDRGPNPFLLVRSVVSGSGKERSDIVGWFVTNQVPNLVEPLMKFLTPIYYLFDARATFWVYIYLLLLIVWMLICWGFFGGVITRMAVLQLAGKDGGGIREAIKFVKKRYVSYLLSPIAPIGLIGFMVVCCMLFGVLHWIPAVGDFVDGLLWWLPLIAGLVMTLLLIGMVGYPMMYTTLSAEGSDTFDALSRSYNYVYESPWHYIWYSAVAIVYGAVLTFFVVVVGSMTAYFAKWGVSKFPAWGADRSPEYLFIYSPESLGWRKLLLEGSPAAIGDDGEPRDVDDNKKYMDNYGWYNYAGAGMTSFWVNLMFLMVIGFSYSYFWTASSQIYLLMRKRVDETEMDEIYVEEEAPPAPAPVTTTPAPAPVPTPTAPVSVPVDAPTLKQPEPPTTPPPAATS